MGHEFLINVKLTSIERQEVARLFKRKAAYYQTNVIDKTEFYEFKNNIFKERMPDLTISFDEKGIYVCKYLKSDLWSDLEDLKSYLQLNGKGFTVEEL